VQASVLGAQFQDVAWAGSQFIAVGIAVGGVESDGVFLDSPDGQTWRSLPVGAADGQPWQVAAGPHGIVAVGEIRGRQSSWASTDGLHWTWHRGAFSASLESDEVATVRDVVATTDGWLAVGRVDPVCAYDCGRTPIRALAWTSSDGITWEHVRRQASLVGGGMISVAAIPGGFVAVGTAGGHAAIWLSTDGRTWSRVPDDPIFAPPPGSGQASYVDANGVASGHGTIVAVGIALLAGSDGAPVVMAWRSDDGRSWTAATVEKPEGGQVFSVAATFDRFLATGPSRSDSCLGGIWASTDGTAWRCEGAAALAGFGPYAAAGSPTVEIAVGLTSAGWDEESELGLPGAVWWRPAG
jgi:hypothetical protein